MKTNVYLVVCPHGFDFALYCGGVIAGLTRDGHRVHILRVTDDCKTSWDLSEEETRDRTLAEAKESAEILGVSSFNSLSYAQDTLTLVPWQEIREKIVRYIRMLKPDAVLSFDPWALYEEEFEHILIARIVEDACRCASAHLYHPEHLEEKLELHAVARRMCFGRILSKVNHVVDIAPMIDVKIKAAQAQRTASQFHVCHFLKKMEINHLRLPLMEEEDQNADPAADRLLEQFIRRHAVEIGHSAGMKLGEGYRLDRFGEMEDFVEAVAEPIRPL